jgi:hypothetical protein
MTTVDKIKNLDKDQLRKVSKALAKQLAINIALGIVATVAVTLISGAIVAKITTSDVAE